MSAGFSYPSFLQVTPLFFPFVLVPSFSCLFCEVIGALALLVRFLIMLPELRSFLTVATEFSSKKFWLGPFLVPCQDIIREIHDIWDSLDCLVSDRHPWDMLTFQAAALSTTPLCCPHLFFFFKTTDIYSPTVLVFCLWFYGFFFFHSENIKNLLSEQFLG